MVQGLHRQPAAAYTAHSPPAPTYEEAHFKEDLINSLPPRLLEHIFAYVPRQERFALPLICRKWKLLVDEREIIQRLPGRDLRERILEDYEVQGFLAPVPSFATPSDDTSSAVASAAASSSMGRAPAELLAPRHFRELYSDLFAAELKAIDEPLGVAYESFRKEFIASFVIDGKRCPITDYTLLGKVNDNFFLAVEERPLTILAPGYHLDIYPYSFAQTRRAYEELLKFVREMPLEYGHIVKEAFRRAKERATDIVCSMKFEDIAYRSQFPYFVLHHRLRTLIRAHSDADVTLDIAIPSLTDGSNYLRLRYCPSVNKPTESLAVRHLVERYPLAAEKRTTFTSVRHRFILETEPFSTEVPCLAHFETNNEEIYNKNIDNSFIDPFSPNSLMAEMELGCGRVFNNTQRLQQA